MTTGQNSFTLSFTLGANDGPAGQPLVTSGQRYWNIKISQIPCNSMLTGKWCAKKKEVNNIDGRIQG